ncbi:MAG: imidazolonepropionase [Bacteroidota bacterium]
MSLLIRNIASLIQVRERAEIVKGKEMAKLPAIDNAYLLLENGLITDYGPMTDCPERANQQIDASGKFVFPCWCDSHTHIVYAGSREAEMVDRIKGLSYEEIARRGGGILNSARRLQNTPEDELLESAYGRLQEVIGYGTGAIEIKSGYGLTVESEMKMLRVIRRLKEMSDVTIKATFLGAHAIPLAYKENRQGYIRLLIDDMLPKIADEGLADYCDVFCDRGFFTVDETSEILEAGWKYGLRPKIHANELAISGGVQVGVKHNALSVDHLEAMGQEEIDVLQNTETMPTLLPSTAFFLGIGYGPARRMIDAGLPVAMATDYNPGSTPSGRMPFVISLGCLKMKMLPEEAINAVTLNSAYAMEVLDNLGSIKVGNKANVFITKPMSSVAFIPYAFGTNLVETVIINGKVV